MNNETVKKINYLTSEFYRVISGEFSKSRQSEWQGWDTCLDLVDIQEKALLKVLDIACGNGRFLKKLTNKYNDLSINYIGIDSNGDLIKEAKSVLDDSKNISADFIIGDVFDLSNLQKNISSKFDIVSAFGITHHLPSKKLREIWFNQVCEFVDMNGFLILSFWNFKDINSNLLREVVLDGEKYISEAELEEEDYFLNWSENKDVYRYCHHYSDEEINSILTMLEFKGLKLIKTLFADGRTNKLNKYLVFKRI